MKKDCELEILKYAPYFRQCNAALYGEYKDYIDIVLKVLRDHHQHLTESGETNWSVTDQITNTLTEMKPY
jgi:hypothetical protein